MESNKDEAEKCLNMGMKHLEKRNYEKAIKFFTKSENLYPSDRAKELIGVAEQKAKEDNLDSSTRDTPSSSNRSNSTAPPRSTESQPHHTQARRRNSKPNSGDAPGPTGEYTAAQLAAVKKIKAARDYYAVLNVQRNADEAELKKAYRKLALQFHPDKNKAPGATDAFKIIGKAFTTLSNPRTREIYNVSGEEAANRSSMAGGSGNPFGDAGDFDAEGLFRQFFGGNIRPEDLIRMQRGGGFGGRRSFVFNMGGGPHPFFQQHAGPTHGPSFNGYQRAAPEQAESSMQRLSRYFWYAMMLYMLYSTFFMSSSQPTETFGFAPTENFRYPRQTSENRVIYYTAWNDYQFDRQFRNPDDLARYEINIEDIYVHKLQEECADQRRLRQSYGKSDYPVRSCEKLRRFHK